MIKKYLFLVVLFSFSFKGNSQSNYAVTPIPFTQYSASSANLATSDDRCSNLIALPFAFDFYGVNYNELVISTNGYIDFRTSSANTSSPFVFTQEIPNVAFPVKNAILGAYSDLNNSNAEGTITYGLYGTAPHRKFVVYFYNNSFFSCTAMKSNFQMILSETSNTIDIQLIDKQSCTAAGIGKTVTGLINLSGTEGIAAPNRNTGTWSAYHEGWRFYRPNYYTNYAFVRCDDDADGFQTFDLNVAANDLSPANPASISFYADMALTIPIINPSAFTNTTNPQTIYAGGNGMIKSVILSVVDCTVDADNDTVDTASEDVNNDTNLANDDTDFDGLPNYLDNDDDGDLILTNVEYVFGRGSQSSNSLLDTDNDSIPNYLDNDDDGDNVLTFMEDYNHNNNPADDDTNANSIPDYLENAVALGVNNFDINQQVSIYPNPASSVLNIENTSNEAISNIAIYAINGALVKEIKSNEAMQAIPVADLQNGIYFVKIQLNQQVINYKFIKQ
ncbi:T9SS type A sorting domain-containing protein [Flavobacterium sp.]|uniref:T9SS type A sorting domain-containing protein n=1 Tax=Flavobacterium sp. TaxID=239 RepID=UPI00286A089A|nr:T9SS type A sorting domain-containing protein [Flavobacterium sp.]